jgi:hypothetical protein
MSSTAVGKIAAGITGMTGTGCLGVTAVAVSRITGGRAVPAGMWVALAALMAVTAVVVAGLGLVLDYLRGKLEIDAQAREAESLAELRRARLEMYRTIVEKSAGEAESAERYRLLILADALHLSVEQNGVRPADRTHGQLYGTQPPRGSRE